VKEGGFGKFAHNRSPTEIDKQTVIRMNQDTLYSWAVFDLDAGPVTIALPDAGMRFMSMQVIDEDHYTPMVVYKPGPVTLTKESIGTRYVIAVVRTLIDPNDANDLDQVHVLQDDIKVSQASPGKFEVPNWDEAGQKKIRDALLVLASAAGAFKKAFGTKAEVDPIKHLLGTAAGWGGNPDKDATYLSVTPAGNDGAVVYKVHVKDVPVDAFWSISLYNGEGFFQKNDLNAYTQQHHRDDECRRRRRCSVRRLRRQDPALPADHEGLELHCAALSPAGGDSRWQLEVPGAAGRELSGPERCLAHQAQTVVIA
jgi:hypothetical protein